jgi:hypothetical protein
MIKDDLISLNDFNKRQESKREKFKNNSFSFLSFFFE